MTQWTEWERGSMANLRRQEEIDLESISCPKCRCQWFEEVEGKRFQLNHNVILGQKVPTRKGSVPYIMLRCMKCQNLIEPRILHGGHSTIRDEYNQFLDTLKSSNSTPSDKKEDIDSQEI